MVQEIGDGQSILRQVRFSGALPADGRQMPFPGVVRQNGPRRDYRSASGSLRAAGPIKRRECAQVKRVLEDIGKGVGSHAKKGTPDRKGRWVMRI